MSPLEVAFAAVQPSNLAAVLVGLGAVLLAFRLRGGRPAVILGALILVAGGVFSLGEAMLRPLEFRFPVPDITEAPDAIVVLGGFNTGTVDEARGQMGLSDRAERITEAAALAARFPTARVLVTDGIAETTGVSGADQTADWLVRLGVPEARIVREGRAMSTWDNAVFARELIQPREGGRYVLVTSAWHMPRSVGTFRAAGWPEMIAYPVDFIDPVGRWWSAFKRPVSQNLWLFDTAAREWIATAYYWASGQSDALVSSPR